jgi:hypothetical protein
MTSKKKIVSDNKFMMLGIAAVLGAGVYLVIKKDDAHAEPAGDSVVVQLSGYPGNASKWMFWIIANDMSSILRADDIPVSDPITFTQIPASWFPLKISMQVVSDPYIHAGHTTPSIDEILYIQSFRDANLEGNPEPSYEPIFFPVNGTYTYSFSSGEFV